jgi:hypothetical protein
MTNLPRGISANQYTKRDRADQSTRQNSANQYINIAEMELTDLPISKEPISILSRIELTRVVYYIMG